MFSDFLGELLRFVVLVFIRPVLLALRAVFSPLYKPLFGWLDGRLLSKDEENFEKDIKQNLPWLSKSMEPSAAVQVASVENDSR